MKPTGLQVGTYELYEGNIIMQINVSADWTGNTNNNVEIKLNQGLDITGWQITTTPDTPNDFVAVEGANNTNNNQNTNTTPESNMPNNVVVDSSVQNSNEQGEQNNNEQPVTVRTEPIVLNTSLDIDKTYYFWRKDS